MAFANLIVKISGDLTSLDRATKQAVERVKSLGAGLSSVGQSIALGFTAPVVGLAGVALKAAGDIEALKLGLVSVAGGAKQAEAQFRQLKEVAKLPGLGLQEAVQGSINLQALGFSADKSKNLLLQFGNALATVGRGREDLNEVIRQLGQLGARGVVTADNLKPIIERVPQVASIIREKFGGEALGNPAETFKKLGISAQEFIAIIETELGKLPRVTGGIKNDFENLKDSVTVAFAAAGEVIAPFAKAFIDDFAVPAIEKAKGLAETFKQLPDPLKAAAVGFGAIVTVAPLFVAGIGSMIANLALITEALAKIGGAAAVAKAALLSVPWIAAGVGVLSLGKALVDTSNAQRAQYESSQQLATINEKVANHLRREYAPAIDELQHKLAKGKIGQEEFAAGLRALALEAGKGKAVADPLTTSLSGVSKGMEEAEKAAQKAATALAETRTHFAKQTLESQVLHRMLGLLNSAHDEMVDRLAKVRLGLINMWDGLPQFSEAVVDVRKLGEGLKIVRDGAEATANALRIIDLSKFDIKPSASNQALFGDLAKQNQKQYEEQLKGAARQAKTFERQVSLVANDLARGLTDLITKGGKLKDVVTSAFADIGKALLRSALEQQFKRIIGLVVDLTSKIPAVSKAIGAIFGVGGGAASAAGGVASTAGSVAGGAASAAGGIAGSAGSAASGAASGVTGIVGAVAGVATAISSIVGNFQMAGMNKSLDLIVKHTLQTANQLIEGIQPQINTYLPYLALIHDRLATINTQGIGVYNAPNDAGLRIVGAGGGAGQTFNFDFRGANLGGMSQQQIETMFREATRKMQLAGAV